MPPLPFPALTGPGRLDHREHPLELVHVFLGFGQQFVGLSLKDFYPYNVQTGKSLPPGKVDQIKNPVPEAEEDFRAALRAVKKNLILVDEFFLNNKHLQYFQPAASGGAS